MHTETNKTNKNKDKHNIQENNSKLNIDKLEPCSSNGGIVQVAMHQMPTEAYLNQLLQANNV